MDRLHGSALPPPWWLQHTPQQAPAPTPNSARRSGGTGVWNRGPRKIKTVQCQELGHTVGKQWGCGLESEACDVRT